MTMMANVRSAMPAFTRHLPCGTGCCWWNWDELEAVYQWLYSREPELIRRAVGRVAAWKARGSLPLMIEITADLMECQQWEGEHRHDDTTDQALSLMYSMAITRFINGVRDECVAISGTTIREILHVVSKVGVPSWLVTLRHLGTHQYLPSLASFRAGAEFALSWLEANYWKPQLQMKPVGTHGVSSASCGQESLTRATAESEPEASGQTDRQADRQADRQSNDPDKATQDPVEEHDVVVVEDSPKLVLTQKDLNLFSSSRQYVHKLRTKPQLVKAIAEANCSTLVDYIKEGLILVFSPPLKYDILVPDITDLASLPQLHFHQKRKSSPSPSPAYWQGHALGQACKREPSTKHKLLAALVVAMHEAECCPKTRDFIGAWLKLFLEMRELETERVGRVDVVVVGVVAAKKQALPGRVDWKKLLETARTHPGYYSYALVKIILDHVGATLSKEVVEKLTYATTLLTLSERIGILEFTVRSSAGAGKYVEKVEELLKAAKENVRSRTKRGRAGGVARKRPASLQDKSGEKQSGDIGESSTGSRKGGEAEVPSAKRPRVQDEEATGEGSGEQALSDDEDVVIVGVTKGKRKSRWNAVSDLESWVRCPLGMCPGQELTPTLLDLPAEMDTAIEGTSPPVDYLQYYGSGTAVEQISDNNDDNMDQVHVHVPPTAATNFDDQEPNRSFTDREIKLIQKRINLF